jgi:hypothetical protein
MNIGGMSTQGGDCFGTFMQSGLPRQTLKDVWQTVAGDMPHLDRQQFVSCLYLMDLAKQGRPVPPSLPPGPFPPGPGSWNQPPSPAASTRFDLGSVQQVHPPPPPPLPPFPFLPTMHLPLYASREANFTFIASQQIGCGPSRLHLKELISFPLILIDLLHQLPLHIVWY